MLVAFQPNIHCSYNVVNNYICTYIYIYILPIAYCVPAMNYCILPTCIFSCLLISKEGRRKNSHVFILVAIFFAFSLFLFLYLCIQYIYDQGKKRPRALRKHISRMLEHLPKTYLLVQLPSNWMKEMDLKNNFAPVYMSMILGMSCPR